MILKSYVKPVNQELKIEYKLDTASKHYDAFKGEQLAIAADGKVCQHLNHQLHVITTIQYYLKINII